MSLEAEDLIRSLEAYFADRKAAKERGDNQAVESIGHQIGDFMGAHAARILVWVRDYDRIKKAVAELREVETWQAKHEGRDLKSRDEAVRKNLVKTVRDAFNPD